MCTAVTVTTTDRPGSPGAGSFRAALTLGLTALVLLITGCGESRSTMELNPEVLGFAAEPEPEPQPKSSPVEPDVVPDELAACQSVTPLRAVGDERRGGGAAIDPDIISTLAEYGADHPESFAGLWLDGGSANGMLIAFADDPTSHLEAITARLADAGLDFDPWLAPFGIATSNFSEVDLLEAERDLVGRGLDYLRDSAIDLPRNRVTLDLLDPSEEDLAALTAMVDLTQVCITVTISPPRPAGPLEVIPQPGVASLLTCGDYPFPDQALVDRRPAIDSGHPALTVLSPFIQPDTELATDTTAGPTTGSQWIVLAADPEHALFGKFGEVLEATALTVMSDGVWEITTWTFGCDLQVGLPVGLGSVGIFIDPDRPLQPEAASLPLLVAEIGCGGGRAMGDRLLEPQVIETETEVLLAFAAVVGPGDLLDCSVSPHSPVSVSLAEPLGSRTVLDATFLPPRPIQFP